MKKSKKIVLASLAVVLITLAVLFVPVHRATYRDGGTREYVSLTYKIVDWNRLYEGGVYENTKIYFGADRKASIDELWSREYSPRNKEYTGEWIDKSAAEHYETIVFPDMIISEIYSNCFFVYPAMPMPYTVKVNGTLGEEWCVGDQITFGYENVYYESKSLRYEADLTSPDSVKEGEWRAQPGMAYKPVIYLYPEETTDVTVTLTPNGDFTCTYPIYDGAWRVTAQPDGTLIDKNGQTYSYLYWEGNIYADYDLSCGFCVKGTDTAEFLEWALDTLGLNRREANEFIVFWLPLMQGNAYNVISFQTDAYTSAAPLDVTPAPDTTLRVFMTYYPSDTFVDVPAQTLATTERNGFTLVEWGGTELK